MPKLGIKLESKNGWDRPRNITNPLDILNLVWTPYSKSETLILSQKHHLATLDCLHLREKVEGKANTKHKRKQISRKCIHETKEQFKSK